MTSKPDEENQLNAYVTPIQYLSSGLEIRFLTSKDDAPPRVQLVLVIDENTGIQRIIESWNEIMAYRAKVIGITGSDLNINFDTELWEIARLHEQGFGYGEIAKILNYRCLALMCCAFNNQEDFEKKPGLGFGGLLFVFVGLRLGEDRLSEWKQIAYEQIEQGIIPWKLEDGPIDRRRVRDNIDYYVDRIKKGQLIIHPNMDIHFGDLMIEASLLQGGWYTKANELLQRDKEYWEKHQKWISNRLEYIKQDIINSTTPFLEDARQWLRNGGNF